MDSAKIIGSCAAVIAALLVFAASAFAEFKSLGEGTTGKGAGLALEAEAGGGRVQCLTTSETGGGPVKWAIKGAGLLMNIEEWGECTVKVGEGEPLKATVTGCELEAKEPGSETKVIGTVVKACIVKASGCEVTVPVEGNKELKEVALAYNGAKNENIQVEPAVTGLTTTVSGLCSLIGIKGTKEGKLKAITVMESLHMGAAAPNFTLSRGGGGPVMRAVNQQRMIIVLNLGTAAKPLTLTSVQTPGGAWFSILNKTENECRNTELMTNTSCTMLITQLMARGAGAPIVTLRFEVTSGGVRSVSALLI